MSAADSRATMAAYGVDFVDEDNAGSVLFALLEEVTDAARAHADEHFHEIGTGNREERHARFARDGAREKCLTSAGGTDQQYTFGNATAQFLELLRLAQEFDDLLELFLGFLNSSDVLERNFLLLRRVQAGATLAKAQGLVAAALHLAHHEDPESDNQGEGQEGAQDVHPVAVVVLLD